MKVLLETDLLLTRVTFAVEWITAWGHRKKYKRWMFREFTPPLIRSLGRAELTGVWGRCGMMDKWQVLKQSWDLAKQSRDLGKQGWDLAKHSQISQNKVKISQIKVKISQNKVKISQNKVSHFGSSIICIYIELLAIELLAVRVRVSFFFLITWQKTQIKDYNVIYVQAIFKVGDGEST